MFSEPDLCVGTEHTDLPTAPSSVGNESTSAPAASVHATDDEATVTGSLAASTPYTSVAPADILPIPHALEYRKKATGNCQHGYMAGP